MGARHIAWLIAGISALLAAVDTVLVAASYPLLSVRSIGIHGWPLVDLAGVGSAVLGAVIVGANPRQAIGWILSLLGLATTISLAAESYSIWVLRYDGQGSVAQGQLLGWVAALLGGPLALTCLTWVFLLVPAGSYLSPGWRWVLRASWAAYGMFVLGLVLSGPEGMNRSGDAIDAPLISQVLISGGVILITLLLLASVGAMLRRLRRSTGAARQQLRVVTLGATGVGLALVLLLVGQSLNEGRQSGWTSVPLYLSYVLLVVCIAVAVLRYRLYEVEVIVSRAVVLALATAIAAVGYVGLVVALGRTFEDRSGGGFWLSLLATVVVALAFQPLRRRVLLVADRVAYGPRAAPYDALAGFSARIGRSPATDELLPTIAAAAGEAVNAHAAVVRVEGGRGGSSATWRGAGWSGTDPAGTDPAGSDVEVPIGDASGRLGTIVLTIPPGRDIRPFERRLLSDIAEHSALALRNVRLELELAAQVHQLDRRTRELAASRNRIISAVDTERRRLESSIAARVLPTLQRLRVELASPAQEAVEAERIQAHVDLTTKALDSLRELTRGIYPTMLTRTGLGPALTSHAARVGRADALRIDPDVAATRVAHDVEAAAYACCVQVLEHPAGEVSLAFTDDRSQLVLVIRGVELEALNMLALVDRIETCGGTLDERGPESHAALRFRLPVTVAAEGPAPPTPVPAGLG